MMPKKTIKNTVQNSIDNLQKECKEILKNLVVAHKDWVKAIEKNIEKAKAEWTKADKSLKKTKAQQAALTGNKKSKVAKKQADKLAIAFKEGKALVQTLKQNMAALLPELKLAKKGLKQHVGIEKIVSLKAKAQTKQATSSVRAGNKKETTTKSVTSDKRGRKVKVDMRAQTENE